MEAIYIKISRDKPTGTILEKEVFNHIEQTISKYWVGLKTELVVSSNDLIEAIKIFDESFPIKWEYCKVCDECNGNENECKKCNEKGFVKIND